MNYEQVAELLNTVAYYYPTFRIDDGKVNAWLDVLQGYDFEEVKQSLNEAMAEDRFQKELPTPYFLVKNLVKKYDKVNYTKQVIYCQICSRPLNQPDLKKHEDRCRSIEYVIRETNKWFNRTLSKKELFEMNDEEFEKRYNQLLRYIYEHTTNQLEKDCIGFVFNPPSEEKAQGFLKGIKNER